MKNRYILSAAALCVLIAIFLIQTTRPRTSNPISTDPSADAPISRAGSDPGFMALAGQQTGVPTNGQAASLPSPAQAKPPETGSPYLDLADPQMRADHVAALLKRDRQERASAHLKADKLGMPKAWTRDGKTFELVAIRNGRVYVRETRNVSAGISTRADKVRQPPYARDGSGVTVAVWDAGAVRESHAEFTGRVVLKDFASFHNHATHVGGTIGAIGANVSAIGMAPQVGIDSYDWVSDLAEIAQQAMAVPGEAGKIQLSNHSYGFTAGWSGIDWLGTWGNRESDSFGLYDSMSAALDEIAYGAPHYLHFKAAGNDRNDNAPSAGVLINYVDESGPQTKPYDPATDPFSDGWDNGGFDTISLEACAKNILTVGAINDAVTAGKRDISKATMTSFSSWGPADDGRVKPDIVANGTALFSAASAGDDIYSVLSGTSMATPNAMGSAALLVEHYGNRFPGSVMRASTIKGLLIHTAIDLGNPGPDYTYGWGLVDTLAGVKHIEAHSSLTNGYRILEDRLTEPTSTNRYSTIWNRSDPITVTLCWTDPPGPIRDGLDIRTPALVHDLDVRVFGPGAEIYRPFVLSATNPISDAVSGDNDIDNVEQVIVTNPSLPGNYEIAISLKGALTDDEQRYSLLVGGSTLPPEIEHTAVINTTNEDDPYVVSARITSEYILNPFTIRLLWSTTGPEGEFTPILMTRAGNNIYSGIIPPNPSGTTIDYRIEASTTNGLSRTSPPVGTHQFKVVEPVILLVTGSPSDIGPADPDYGVHSFASGITVHAMADVFTEPIGGTRNINTGWEGVGSVPAGGSTNELDFEIHRQSALAWQWKPGYRLSETSSFPGVVDGESWWEENTTGQTIVADAASDGNGTNYMFAGWYVDGSRIPGGIEKAANPAYPIVMDAPKAAVAHYLSESEDLDLDTVPDWWEFLFLGSTGVALNVDLDNDGFTSISEFRDGTDPHDNASFPSAPSIAHVPLNNIQGAPAPYLVSADVMDNFMLDSANLEWNVNSTGWQTTPMELTASGIAYTSAIPSPVVTGDQLQYRIIASDASGLQAVNGIYTVDIRYPVMSLSPTNFGTSFLRSNVVERAAITVKNEGHDTLEWSLTVSPAGLYDKVEIGTNGWTHGGAHDVWHISSRRAYSGSNSWYFGNPTTARYPDSAKAWLISPPVFLAEDSVFSYRQWLETEELHGPATAWDGCIVELSTNNGASYFQLDPEGGYPYEIFWHPASAFPSNTQMFAGTVDWEKREFPLGEYAGQVVRLRMHFGSDGFVTAEGWYVDDLFVEPYGGASDWLDIAATNGSVDQLDSESEQAFLNTSCLDLSETRQAAIFVDSNDPVSPMGLIPVGLHNASREIVVYVTGSGTVNPSGAVYLALGDTTNFNVEADPLNLIAEITTNGLSVGNVFGMSYTNFVWSEVNFNGTGVFRVAFEPILTTNSVPEAWLVSHGLTNGTPENEAVADHDMDTLLTWQEFIAGTDPTNSESVFLVPCVMPYGDYVAHTYVLTGYDGTLYSGTQFVLEVTGHSIAWPSVSNRIYRVYKATNVFGEFDLCLPPMEATPPTNTYLTTPDDLSGGFYRLGVELAD